MRPKRVLIGCEQSATMRDAFIKRGFDAVSCDILPTDSNSGPHYQGDVRDILHWGWDLFIVHPVCRYICNSGVRWLYETPGRWEKMKQGAEFFKEMLDAPIEYIAAENPIPHKYAVKIIGRTYDQLVQPWQFGHGETKATCWWLKNLPPLKPTNIVEGREQRIWKMSPGANRSKDRSKSFPGICEAAANQWGAILNNEAVERRLTNKG